ncbi:MAG: alpha/beta hydrolase [Chitinophagales bacterium]
MKLIEEQGFQYYQTGKGPVIILMHGLFGALSNFYDFIRYFENKFTIYLPVLPVYSLPAQETSIDGMVNYLSDFINFKALKDFSILGNSLGGHIALLYCLKHQDRVKSLVLTGSSGLFENALGDSYPRKSDYDYVRKKAAYTFYNPDVATDDLVDEIYEIVNDKEKAMRILHLAKSALRHNLSASLSVLTIPVLLIWGKEDRITPPRAGEEFHKLLPNSELYYLDKCGHAPMMERPKEFNKVTESFFDRINRK